jgi:ParB-like nuclease family protein
MTKSWPIEDGKKLHWSKMVQVHPAAAVFPMLPEEEMKALVEDIKEHGLQQPPMFWAASNDTPIYLLDGRNRLEACMEADIDPGWSQFPASGWMLNPPSMLPENADPVSFIISANVRRRHLTKKQQADVIVKARKAAQTDPANTRSVPRNKSGQVCGSTKDPVREAVMADCAAQGISERTAKMALHDHAKNTDQAKIAQSVSAPETTVPESKPKAKGKKWSLPRGIDSSSPKKEKVAAVWECMAYLKLKYSDLA